MCSLPLCTDGVATAPKIFLLCRVWFESCIYPARGKVMTIYTVAIQMLQTQEVYLDSKYRFRKKKGDDVVK